MRYNWPEVKLSELCSYRQERVAVDELTVENYISTANMLPNKGGIEPTESLPSSSTANRYYAGDVLISNIRPYFKKAWYATTDGGCSSDVLVLRAKEGVHPEFLYYLLTSDTFFSYMTATSKGTKMPRGDKQAIMNWRALKPPLHTQRAIADTLSCLDAKIDLNIRINDNLEKQAQAIFKNWFVDFEPFKDGEFIDSPLGLIPKGWKVEKLEDLVNIKYGKDHRSLPDGDIPVYGSGGLIRYISEAIYTSESVLIPRKGTLNNVMLVNHPFWSVDTMFYTEINKPNFAKFLFQLLKRKDLASMNVGSAVPSMTVALLNQIRFVLPPDEILEQFERVTNPFYLKIENNRRQNQILAALRDTLLPKLMSGEIEVPVV
jgi:type I restriction enzyme S subunit